MKRWILSAGFLSAALAASPLSAADVGDLLPPQVKEAMKKSAVVEIARHEEDKEVAKTYEVVPQEELKKKLDEFRAEEEKNAKEAKKEKKKYKKAEIKALRENMKSEDAEKLRDELAKKAEEQAAKKKDKK